MLRPKLKAIIDAVEPGGSGDMSAGLTEREQKALTEVTKFGFPPRSWFNYEAIAFCYTGVLASLLGIVISADPTYFEDSWQKPGYLGADNPDEFKDARVHAETTISGMLYPEREISKRRFTAPGFAK
ncbi:MAG: hypothetical protein JXA30_21910 [Deltaproteobacteria bacterium]|nr:hypothetical protein [Deltaproteobacteria bacterium]